VHPKRQRNTCASTGYYKTAFPPTWTADKRWSWQARIDEPVVVIGAGLAGLSGRVLPGRPVTTSQWWNERRSQAVVPVCISALGLSSISARSSLPRPISSRTPSALATDDSSINLYELLPMRRAQTDVPGLLCRWQHEQCALRSGGDAGGSPRRAAAWTPPPSTHSLTGCASSIFIFSRCQALSTGITTPHSAPVLARALARLARSGAFGRLGAAVRMRFKDPRLHRLFSFQAMCAALAPDSALPLYAVTTYMDTIKGVWFPEGGIHAVPTIMAQVVEKAGAVFGYGDPVETILRSSTVRVAGVRTASGERIMPTRWFALSIFRPRTNNFFLIFVRHEQSDAATTPTRL
jgi:hypothetical protein